MSDRALLFDRFLFFSLLLSGCSADKCVYNCSFIKIYRQNGTLSTIGESQPSGGGLLYGEGRWWVVQPQGGGPENFLYLCGPCTCTQQIISNNCQHFQVLAVCQALFEVLYI